MEMVMGPTATLPYTAAHLLTHAIVAGEMTVEVAFGRDHHLVLTGKHCQWILDMAPHVYCEDLRNNTRYSFTGPYANAVLRLAKAHAHRTEEIRNALDDLWDMVPASSRPGCPLTRGAPE